jgi:F0F1-type ATP synthase alpha subunit
MMKSDGIARVHGMSNVQAEELVEYEAGINMDWKQTTNTPKGSRLASRVCA